MAERTPTKETGLAHRAAGNLAFLLSVVRCGETLGDDEEALIRDTIDRLEGRRIGPGIEEHGSREIVDHHDGHGLTEAITIRADALDPSAGAASHFYVVTLGGEDVARIQFQHGPRDEPGSLPGVVESVLLAIVADRMRCFNAGPFGCRQNALVLTKVEEAMHWLKDRADERARRGVLGKAAK